MANILARGQVIIVEDFDESSYQPRQMRTDKREKEGKKWPLLLALLLIIIAAISIFWYMSNRSQDGLSAWLKNIITTEEEVFQITLPEAIFNAELIEDVVTGAVTREEIEQVEQADENLLTYSMTAEARDKLLREAANYLEEAINALYDPIQHPYMTDFNYDSEYTDFYLIIDQEEVQNDQALVTASELYMLALYYQILNSAEEPTREISVTIEDHETGYILDQITYPDHLNRAAAVLKNLKELADTPATPQAGDRVIVATGTDNLNLRNGPEITYLIIEILSSGTVLEVTGVEGAWIEVITPQGREGWVHGNFVELYSEDD